MHEEADIGKHIDDNIEDQNENVPIGISEDGMGDVILEGFPCPVAGCPRKLQLKRSIKRHVRDHHGQPTSGGYSRPRVRCLICQTICLNAFNYGIHHNAQHSKQKKKFESIELKSKSQVLV